MQRERERQNITDFLPFYGHLTRSHNFDLLPSKEASRVMMFKPFEMPFFVHLWCLLKLFLSPKLTHQCSKE